MQGEAPPPAPAPAPPGLSAQVLDYYKRFGRHRDLEQYFSLTTVQGEPHDPSSMFWSSIKTQPDSSDSGGKLSEPASTELCRISINCTLADPSSNSQDGSGSARSSESAADKQNSESPPIINEDNAPPPASSLDVDSEHKSDLDTSRKSEDLHLDTSLNKPQSPTSSVTSQRKLEWDSLADVGYANENDRKPTAASLSTLERLALQQQFSISDDIKNDISGRPAAHSTPLEEEDKLRSKKNSRKGLLKKATTFSQKDFDVMEINLDKDEKSLPGNIHLNLTKHISFHVDPDTGSASISRTNTGYKVEEIPVTNSVDSKVDTGTKVANDKEIQTTLPRNMEKATKGSPHNNIPDQQTQNIHVAAVPVFVNVSDMLKLPRHRGLKYLRNKIKNKKKKISKHHKSKKERKVDEQKNTNPLSEVIIGGSQVSEADSFEYMPAHVYHQNTARNVGNQDQNNETSNKTSSLESSDGYTTHSSKQSDHSFTKDLEMSITLLNKLVQQRHQDANLKKKLVKEVVQRLISTNYRDDESSTDFLSGLSFSSSLLGLGLKDKSRNHHTTTSTSDTNNSGDAPSRPRKSILRSPAKPGKKSGDLTAHYVQNKGEQPSTSSPRNGLQAALNPNILEGSTSTTSRENISREKTASEDDFPKTSSEQIYQCYLKALKKEEEYKKHLKVKQEFMKQKLLKKEIPLLDVKSTGMKDLIDDLTKNNSWHAAGDGALKAVDSIVSNADSDKNSIARKQRSHSVFTLSSGNSERKFYDPASSKHKDRQNSSAARSATVQTEPIGAQNTTQNQQMPMHSKFRDQQNTIPRSNKPNLHYCCCPYHSSNTEKIDSVVQISEQLPKAKNCTGTNFDATAGHSANLKACVRNVALQTVPNSSVSLFRDASTVNSDDNMLQTEAANNKLICFCTEDGKILSDVPDNFIIYKCCRMPYALMQPDSKRSVQATNSISIQCSINDGQKDEMVLVEQSSSSHSGKVASITSAQNIEKDSYETEESSCNVIDKLKSSAETAAKINKMTENLNKEQQNNESVQIIKLQHDRSIQSHLTSTSDSDLSDGIRREIHSIPQSPRVSKDNRICSETVNLSRRRESKHMQTSVSIDPKISEPTLADVNIVQDNDCTHANIHTNTERHLPTKYSDFCGNNAKDLASFDNEQIVQRHQISKDSNQQFAYKRQKETEAVIEAIMHSGSLSGKNSERNLQRSCNINFKKYLNAKDSDSTDLDMKQASITRGINTEVICKSDTGTSLTDVNKTASKTDQIDLTENYLMNQGPEVNFDKNVKKMSRIDVKSKKRVETFKHGRDDYCLKSSRRASVAKEVECNNPIQRNSKDDSNIIDTGVSTDVPKYDKTYQGMGKDKNRKNNANTITTASDPIYVNVETSGANILSEKSNHLLQFGDNALSKSSVGSDDERNYLRRASISDTAINQGSINSKYNIGTASNYSKNEPSLTSKYKNLEFNQPSKSTFTESMSKVKSTIATKSVPNEDKENFPDNNNMEIITSKSSESKSTGNSNSSTLTKEILIDSIKDIIKRYAKEDKPMTVDKRKSRNKYYKEIIGKLQYLLQTEVTDTGETSDSNKSCIVKDDDTLVDNQILSSETGENAHKNQEFDTEKSQKAEKVPKESQVEKKHVTDKATQLRNGSSHCKLPRERVSSGTRHGHKRFPSEDSSDILMSSDMPGTSSDSFTYQIIRKIKRECDKFHQKHCQCCEKMNMPIHYHYDASSSTSVNRHDRIHCPCRSAHRCRSSKTQVDKMKKKSIAYNLIIQPSDSVDGSDTVPVKDKPALKDIVVKVPSRRKNMTDKTSQNFNQDKDDCEMGEYIYTEQTSKQPEQMKKTEEKANIKLNRSRSLPEDSEMSSVGEVRKIKFLTVRECLELNRPDFVSSTNERQRCLRVIQEQRVRQQRAQRKVLSLQVERHPDLKSVSMTDLRELARRFGEHVRTKRPDAKFLNEREMKQHSRKIYKTLPEVVQKKEQLKKDHIKKTNMVMTSLFNKNLQKKVLRGSVDISNYSTIIKI